MLGLLGLLSAMIAGIMGDSIVNAQPSPNNDDDDLPPADDGSGGGGNLVDDPEPLPDEPVVERPEPPMVVLPEPLPGEDGLEILPPQLLFGTNDAELMIGRNGQDAMYGAGGEDTLAAGGGHDALSGADDDDADLLLGEDGNDLLTLGAGDTATGGTGFDRFTLADFGPNTPPSVITDYSAADDQIVLMYDPQVHPEPVVSMERVEGTEDMSVMLDGVQIAIVQSATGLTQADIQLMAA